MDAMNGHIPLQPVNSVALQIVSEDREEDIVPESNELLRPQVLNPSQEKAKWKYTTICWRCKPHICSKNICWRCKLWMLFVFFFFLIIVTILTLFFYSAVYIDEDEYWDPESIASGNPHNFSGTLKFCCAAPQLLSDLRYDWLSDYLRKRLTDIYNNSLALGRYFISAEVISIRRKELQDELTKRCLHFGSFTFGLDMEEEEQKFPNTNLSEENSTVTYHLRFSVPADETEEFMKYRMNTNFVMNILRQDIYDKEETDALDISGCRNMTLDPTSITLTQLQDNTVGG